MFFAGPRKTLNGVHKGEEEAQRRRGEEGEGAAEGEVYALQDAQEARRDAGGGAGPSAAGQQGTGSVQCKLEHPPHPQTTISPQPYLP